MNAKELRGTLTADGLRIGIVVSRFNDFLTEQLLDGATTSFVGLGGALERLTIVRVPGAFEIPLALKKLAEAGDVDALVALGVVIDGETPHASLITTGVVGALTDIALAAGLPVIDGVVAARDLTQAIDRCGAKSGNRGWSAMQTAIEMANLCRLLGSS